MSVSAKTLLNASRDNMSRSRFSYSECASPTKSTNEFITEQLEASRLEEYTSILKDYEKSSIKRGKFRDAELAVIRVEELKKQGIEYNIVMKEDECKKNQEKLVQICSEKMKEFNSMWDKIIKEHYEGMKITEQEMIAAQKEELQKFDEEIDEIVIPKPKFNKDVLNIENVIPKLIDAKRYREAEALTKKLKTLKKQQSIKWDEQHQEKFARKREIFLDRQRVDLEALQGKLENSLQEKLRVRAKEFKTFLQRIQNMKNDLDLHQSQEKSKLNMLSTKAKNVWDIPTLLSQSSKASLISQMVESSRYQSGNEDDKQ